MTASQRKWSAPEYGAMALAAGTPLAFLASIPWLKDQPDGQVYLLTGIAAFTVIAASTFLSAAGQAKMDEVQRAGSRFAYLWGGLLGAALIAILLAVPPFHDLIYRLVSVFEPAGAAAIDRETVLMAYTLGFGSVVLAQSVGTLLANGAWRLWMSRS